LDDFQLQRQLFFLEAVGSVCSYHWLLRVS
jgi:hypothetical protein